MPNSKILLIGGAGFIGSNLIKVFYKKGITDISVLEPKFASISKILDYPVHLYRGGLSDMDLIESILETRKINIVIHLVSTIIPGSDYKDFQREFTDVIFPSIQLMEQCCRRDIMFVYFSSGGTIYGEHNGETIPVVEDTPMAPISFYGWSKQMMENSVLYMNRTQKLNYLILRPSNPYGHGQNLHGKQGFIATAIGKILAGEKIIIWGDGSSIRDYIYIDDLCYVVTELLLRPNICNTTINIGSGIGNSVNNIIEYLRKIVSEDFEVEYVSARKMDVSSIVLNIEKVKKILDFRPLSLMEGITKFYNTVKNGK